MTSSTRTIFSDEDDVRFEQSGTHDVGVRIDRIKTVPVRNVTRRGGPDEHCDDGEDYDGAAEDSRFDPEFKRKPASENDFIRGLQTVLIEILRELVSRYALPDALELECRKVNLLRESCSIRMSLLR